MSRKIIIFLVIFFLTTIFLPNYLGKEIFYDLNEPYLNKSYSNSQLNNPPEIPSISGPLNGYSRKLYDYAFTTIDPDGDNVYYYIDWGDGTDSGWLGPYISGDVGYISNMWNDEGSHFMKIKAKDVYGAESDWSDEYWVFMIASIKIDLKGGFGVKVIIENVGSTDYENIPWNFYFHDAFMMVGQGKSGTLDRIKAGEKITIKSGFIFGFSLNSFIEFGFNEPIGMATGRDNCQIFGPFTILS